jgi:hypothetical protein
MEFFRVFASSCTIFPLGTDSRTNVPILLLMNKREKEGREHKKLDENKLLRKIFNNVKKYDQSQWKKTKNELIRKQSNTIWSY